MRDDEKIYLTQLVSNATYHFVNAEPLKDADFVVEDDEGNIVYQGKDHPWVELFKRIEKMNSRLNKMFTDIYEIKEFLNI